MKRIGFFEESEGSKSMNRLITFIWALYAVAFSSWVFYSTKDYTAGIAVFVSVSGIAAGTKLVQKTMEKKDSNENTN